jgi:N-acetylglutamate synthase-like GNAT family acetyltransferase
MTGLNDAAQRYVKEKNIPPLLFQELNQYFSLVYLKDDVILGLGSLDRNEIKRMYTHPSAQGQGVGRTILQNLEMEARRQGLKNIFIQSSTSAEGFYKLRGFVRIEPGSFTHGDALFQFVNLEKQLSNLTIIAA